MDGTLNSANAFGGRFKPFSTIHFKAKVAELDLPFRLDLNKYVKGDKSNKKPCYMLMLCPLGV